MCGVVFGTLVLGTDEALCAEDACADVYCTLEG